MWKIWQENVCFNGITLHGSIATTSYNTDILVLQYSLRLTVYCGDILFCSRSVFIQATTECYIPLESVWRRNLKKSVGPSVCLSACPFVTLTKKAYSFFIIDSRKIIHISGERTYYPLQENKAIFKKIVFKNFRPNFRNILYLHKMPTPPSL